MFGKGPGIISTSSRQKRGFWKRKKNGHKLFQGFLAGCDCQSPAVRHGRWSSKRRNCMVLSFVSSFCCVHRHKENTVKWSLGGGQEVIQTVMNSARNGSEHAKRPQLDQPSLVCLVSIWTSRTSSQIIFFSWSLCGAGRSHLAPETNSHDSEEETWQSDKKHSLPSEPVTADPSRLGERLLRVHVHPLLKHPDENWQHPICTGLTGLDLRDQTKSRTVVSFVR